MSYRSHRTGPDRMFDHLYDPLYITSGPKDTWKENHNALYRSAPILIYPQYGTMFTDLPGRPRNYYIQQRNPLPHFPFVDENGQYNNSSEGKLCRPAAITGRDRAKFFNIPLNSELTLNLQLDMSDKHICCEPSPFTPKEAFRSVACETLYREQSAQTKPWMPDAIIEESCAQTPELVYAAKSIACDDTPGILEVRQLERARRRRQIETKIAQNRMFDDWNKRRVVLEALEWEDRVGREEEINYCQKLRLGMVQNMMDSRENKMNRNFSNQIESIMNRQQMEKDKALNKIRTTHQRTLRRLEKQYGGKSKTNKALAPEQKETSFMSYNTDFEARLDELHKMPTMPSNLDRFIQPKIDITKPKMPIKEVKKGFWTEKFLLCLYESLKVVQKKIVQQRMANCIIDIREEVISYVSTAHPSIETFDNELEYQHAVFLQKIIKGRAVQSILHDGKSANQELINELKKSFKLQSVWKAEICDDWNEDNMMEFLAEYIDHEFNRYAEQKNIRDNRLLLQREEMEKQNKIENEKIEISTDYLNNILTNVFRNLPDSGAVDSVLEEVPEEDAEVDLSGHPAESVVSHVLHNSLLSEIFKTISDEELHKIQNKGIHIANRVTQTDGKDQIIKDTINYLITKIIPNPVEELTDTLIDELVKKIIQLSEGVDTRPMDYEIGDILKDICSQLFTSIDEEENVEPGHPDDDDDDDDDYIEE